MLISTRDGARQPCSYTEALLSGLASDGGLYVPVTYPRFSSEELVALSGASYETIAFAVKSRLVDGSIPDAELKELITSAYGPGVFDREKGSIVPVTEIEKGLFVQSLSLGPTASFKDMALQLVGREMDYELSRRNQKLRILGATSGDTGSAAEAAIKDRKNACLFMLSPEKGMSTFQRAQMEALSGGNIFNISIRGRFDDCQDLVKATMQDPEFASLGAVNSINWGRISSQVPYYFAGYLQVAKRMGDPVDVCVPSGNFGNIFSAYVAKRMGLPLRRLIIATNENNVLDVLLKTGVYEQKEARITSSPSMDISKASNYERLVFDLFQGDAEKVKAYMSEFAKTGKASLKDHGLDPSVFFALGFEGDSSTHTDRIETIRQVYTTTKIVIDPHTADGVCVGKRAKHDEVSMLCMSTALPVKFEGTIQEALGFVPERPPRFVGLEEKTQGHNFVTMSPDAALLKSFLRTH